MDLTETSLALTGALAIVVVAGWRARQPWRPGRVWRVPWHAIMAVALVLCLGLLAHLGTLITGETIVPRALR